MAKAQRPSIWLFCCICVVAVAAIGLTVAFLCKTAKNSGDSPEETAAIIVHDSKAGMRAIETAINHGDSILTPLREQSGDFSMINTRNCFWIAEFLSENKTTATYEVLIELFGRQDSLQKLVGAVGLASHVSNPTEHTLWTYLLNVVNNQPGQTERELAIIGLGKTRSRTALPVLTRLLRDTSVGYWSHAYSCDAIAEIASTEAIPPLKEALRDPSFKAIPNAFDALVSLGERDAIPLAIDRISPDLKGSNGSRLVHRLEEVTGESHGYNKTQWRTWWDATNPTWELPRPTTTSYSSS